MNKTETMTEEQRIAQYQYHPIWRRKKVWILLGILALLCIPLFWYSRITPLPKDEEMIAYFQAHRAEFEEVIRRNRDFIKKPYDPNVRFPAYEEGMKELMEQAGIHDVNPLMLGRWLPDPYNLATVQQLVQIEKACADDWKQYNAMDGMKRKLTPPQCRLLDYQYGGLRVKIEPYNKYFSFSWKYISVWKEFIHFPEPPKVENGYLLGPLDLFAKGQFLFKKRAFSSLNYYPSQWGEYECVYRRVDAHWFLSLCNGH